jgi:hypothetical protein
MFVTNKEIENMKNKTLKYVFSIILFFSLFTTKAMRSPFSYIECEVDKDCHDAITAKDMEYLKASGVKLICQNRWCRVIPF